MTFERTYNYLLLGELLRDPKLYPFLTDDFSAPLEEVAAIEHPALWYILARDADGELLGFWLFAMQNAICWEFHTVMPLNAAALQAIRELLGPDGWLWSHTPCLRAVTTVPASNAIAHRFGLRAGLLPYGRNPESFMKNGWLQDLILLGINRPKDT
jgi:hypothetical protein